MNHDRRDDYTVAARYATDINPVAVPPSNAPTAANLLVIGTAKALVPDGRS